MRHIMISLLTLSLAILVACKASEPAAEPASAPEAEAAPAPAPEAVPAAEPEVAAAPDPAAAAEGSPADCELEPVYFKPSAEELVAESVKALQVNVECIKRLGATEVYLEGHTDDRKESEFSLALGQRYANKVRDALVKGGIPKEKIETVSFGRERPSCEERTPECRAKNRRCDLRAE